MDTPEKVFFRHDMDRLQLSSPFTSAEAAIGTAKTATISEYRLVSTRRLHKRVLIEEEPETAPDSPPPPPPEADMPF